MALDLPNLGAHCHLSDCNILDYLPWTCTYCKYLFCKDHWEPESHNCLSYIDKSNHVVISESIKPIEKSKKLCSYPKCRDTSPVIQATLKECSICKDKFCYRHRFHNHQHPKK